MSGALAHIDSLMVDWTDDLKDGMNWRPQVYIHGTRLLVDSIGLIGLIGGQG